MKPSIVLISSFLVLTVAFLIFQGSVPSGSESQSVVHSEQPSAKDNFLKFCAGCHGNQMERFAGKTWEAYSSGNDLTPVIKYGLPVLGMPSFEKAFSDAEMKAISKYILTEIKNKKQTPSITRFPPVVRSKHQAFRIDTVAKGLCTLGNCLFT